MLADVARRFGPRLGRRLVTHHSHLRLEFRGLGRDLAGPVKPANGGFTMLSIPILWARPGKGQES